jgi:DNA-binding MarR family transcriptional regulator
LSTRARRAGSGESNRFADGSLKSLPLSSLLSQALVAFTIEFDNEFENRTPHRTTNHGATPGARNTPWLVSMAMWLKFMQFVRDDGVSVRELQGLTQLSPKEMGNWLTRMGKWWGYVVIEPGPAGSHSKQFDANSMIRPTPGGRKALESWRPLTGVIEKHWQERFGKEAIDQLQESLRALISQFKIELPDYLPILGYGLFSKSPNQRRGVTGSEHGLPTLLAKMLLAFALEFERGSELSLAICANVLRLAGEQGVRVRELPRLAGVSKEAIAVSLSFLQKCGYAVAEPESSESRVKTLRLTPKGRHARDTYQQLVWTIEGGWQELFGKDTIAAVRVALEHLNGDAGEPLLRGLEPYPAGWRAAVPKLETLPHYPMILHRGGFPDGS